MKVLKRIAALTVFALSLGTAFSGPVLGQEEAKNEDRKDLSMYICKDVMRATGNDRDVVIGVLHAFILGKKGTSIFEVQKLADATDKFIEHCLDNPNDKALEIMEKITK